MLSVGLFANGSYGQCWGGVHKLFKDGQWMRFLNDSTIKDYATQVVGKYTTMIGTDPKTGGWTDVGVTGIFGKWFGAPEGDFSQFSAQLLDVAVCFVFIFAFSMLFMKISNIFVKIRSTKEHEMEGLDVPEMGVEAYPDFQTTDRTSPKID